MWKDIALSIASAVSEAIYSNRLDRKKKEKVNSELTAIIVDKINEFSDTSLDCKEFELLVKGYGFREVIRNKFCSIKDGLNYSEYLDSVEKYICKECSSVNILDVRNFLNKIDELYENFLRKMIEEHPDLNLFFQLMTISHRGILSRISESDEMMGRYIESLSGQQVSIEDKDIAAYHEVCRKEYGYIRFTGISGAENKKAQDILNYYVPNTFSCYSEKELENVYKNNIDQIKAIELKDFFDLGNKIVLIGGAGLGKSTTLNYLFCTYEKMYNAHALKIKIDLKEYAKNIGEEKKDLLWCIASEFYKKIKRTKLTFDEVEKLLANYLDAGKCLVILDALDEIPTQAVRSKVRDEIGSFCEIYYLNRFIISTREAGYLRNRFDDNFLHIKINDFESEQIKKYSNNWFCSNYDKKDFADFWDKFSIEVARAKCEKLISNPIVLILALVIFDIEKNLPNKRVEFYKKCIETFLTVREDRKGAFVLHEKAKNILGIDSVVPKIAHFKFNNIRENIGYKFSYEELKKSVLLAIEVEDEINWIEPVRQYSQYLVERTELVREVDEDILDFAHKTFYEYFLAVYFSKELGNEELLALLDEWIGDANYDELARLIIEVIIQNNDPRQHKCVLEHLFERIKEEKNDASGNVLDILMILVDLYNHNMLQPKFHALYNRIMLFYPFYVERVNTHMRILSRGSKKSDKVRYDVEALVDICCNKISENKLHEVIDALYCLDESFAQKVIEKTQEKHISHIVNIFRLVKKGRNSLKDDKNSSIANYEKEWLFFMNEGKYLVKEYSQIYVAVIETMVVLEKYDYAEDFYSFSFSENASAYEYTVPQNLVKLVDVSRKNAEFFLLLLLVIIECGKKKTNVFIGYLVDIRRNTEENEEFEKCISDFTYWIWKALHETNSYEEFQKIIKKENLYIEKYDYLYRKMYENYCVREKKIEDIRLTSVLRKIQTKEEQ